MIERFRIRSASPEVIKLLLEYGAKTEKRTTTSNGYGPSALTVLLNHHGFEKELSEESIGTKIDTTGGRSRRVWLKCVEALIQGGARWETALILRNGGTQLTQLFAFFPPSPSDVAKYIHLVRDAIDAGFNLMAEDRDGRIPLFTLCERMASTVQSHCPESPKILEAVMKMHGRSNVGIADKSGMTVMDIPDRVEKSCLALCRSILADMIMGSFNYDTS